MKISAYPKCWIEDLVSGKMDLMEWIDRSTGLECEGLELKPAFLRSFDRSYLRGIRTAIEERGMVVSMMCHSPDFTIQDPDGLKEEIAAQKEAMRVSAELECGFCRTLSGQKRPGLDEEKTLDQVVSCIEECLPEAERCGVKLVMENHYKDTFWKYPEFAQKMNLFTEIVDRIQSPWFGVQFDPSNTVVAGENPIELLERVLPRVLTMHASDRYLSDGVSLESVMDSIERTGYPEGLVHGVTGEGLNDYPLIFRKLRAAGFDGWVSIEDGIHGMDEMKRSVDYLKYLRDIYFVEGSSK